MAQQYTPLSGVLDPEMYQNNLFPGLTPNAEAPPVNPSISPLFPQSAFEGTPSFMRGFTQPNGVGNVNGGGFWNGVNNVLGSDSFKGFTQGLGAISGLADSWAAFQGLGLAQDQFDFKRDAFNQQFNNQRTLTNAALEDRQRRRVSASGTGPSGYRSVADYMAANSV